jgi:hypothetical protein
MIGAAELPKVIGITLLLGVFTGCWVLALLSCADFYLKSSKERG